MHLDDDEIRRRQPPAPQPHSDTWLVGKIALGVFLGLMLHSCVMSLPQL
jgi:hypothetical protein